MVKTNEDAIRVIQNERNCVIRASTCNRDCSNCDLVLDENDILSAYDAAIEALIKDIRREKFIKELEERKYG